MRIRFLSSLLLAVALFIPRSARSGENVITDLLAESGLAAFTPEQRRLLTTHVDITPPAAKPVPSDILSLAVDAVPDAAAVKEALANDATLSDFIRQMLERTETPVDANGDDTAADARMRELFGTQATPRDVLIIAELADLAWRYAAQGDYAKALPLLWAARQRVPESAYQYVSLTHDMALALAHLNRPDECLRLILDLHFNPNTPKRYSPHPSPNDAFSSMLLRARSVFHYNYTGEARQADRNLMSRATFLAPSPFVRNPLRYIEDEAKWRLLDVADRNTRPMGAEEETAWMDSATAEWARTVPVNRPALPLTTAFLKANQARLDPRQRALVLALLGEYEPAARLAAVIEDNVHGTEAMELLRKILLLASGDPRLLLPDGGRLDALPWAADTKNAIRLALRRHDPTGEKANAWREPFIDLAFGPLSDQQFSDYLETRKATLPPESYIAQMASAYAQQTGTKRDAALRIILREAGGGDADKTIAVLAEWAGRGGAHRVYQRIAAEYAFREGRHQQALDLVQALPESEKNDRMLLAAALAELQMERDDRALAALDMLLEKWPGSESAERGYTAVRLWL